MFNPTSGNSNSASQFGLANPDIAQCGTLVKRARSGRRTGAKKSTAGSSARVGRAVRKGMAASTKPFEAQTRQVLGRVSAAVPEGDVHMHSANPQPVLGGKRGRQEEEIVDADDKRARRQRLEELRDLEETQQHLQGMIAELQRENLWICNEWQEIGNLRTKLVDEYGDVENTILDAWEDVYNSMNQKKKAVEEQAQTRIDELQTYIEQATDKLRSAGVTIEDLVSCDDGVDSDSDADDMDCYCPMEFSHEGAPLGVYGLEHAAEQPDVNIAFQSQAFDEQQPVKDQHEGEAKGSALVETDLGTAAEPLPSAAAATASGPSVAAPISDSTNAATAVPKANEPALQCTANEAAPVDVSLRIAEVRDELKTLLHTLHKGQALVCDNRVKLAAQVKHVNAACQLIPTVFPPLTKQYHTCAQIAQAQYETAAKKAAERVEAVFEKAKHLHRLLKHHG